MSHWLERPDILKAAFFGRDRDLGLLCRLTERYESLGEQLQVFGTKLRSGLIYGDHSNDSLFLCGLPVVTRVDIQPFTVSKNLKIFESDHAQRPRKRDVYQAPLLLVRESLQSGGRAVCAVSE